MMKLLAAAVLVAAGATAQLVAVPAASAATATATRIVTQRGPIDSASTKSVTVTCPAGTRVYGGGGQISGGLNEVSLTGLVPGATTYTATAEEDDTGYNLSWYLTAWAVCGPDLGSMTIQSGTVAYTGGDRVNASANCPTGTAPVGLGAKINNGHNNVVLNLMLGNYTAGPYGQFRGFSTATAFVDQTGSAPGWSLTSYAVCARPPAGLTYRFVDSTRYDSGDKDAFATCPSGTRVFGVGGYLSPLSGQVHFDQLLPNGLFAGYTSGKEDQDGFAGNWWIETEAICAA